MRVAQRAVSCTHRHTGTQAHRHTDRDRDRDRDNGRGRDRKTDRQTRISININVNINVNINTNQWKSRKGRVSTHRIRALPAEHSKRDVLQGEVAADTHTQSKLRGEGRQ